MATAFIHHQGIVVWEWCNEHMRWRPYESHVSNHIEGHYLQNPNMIVTFQGIDQNMTSYQLNLSTKEQVRLSTGKKTTLIFISLSCLTSVASIYSQHLVKAGINKVGRVMASPRTSLCCY